MTVLDSRECDQWPLAAFARVGRVGRGKKSRDHPASTENILSCLRICQLGFNRSDRLAIAANITMADLIRTIESDDEDFQASPPASTSTAVVLDSKKRKRDGGNQAANASTGKKDSKKARGKAAVAAKNDVKGKGKQVEQDDALAGEFQFDALGGGEYLSRGARLGDAWVSMNRGTTCIPHMLTRLCRTSTTCPVYSRNAMHL